MAWHKGAQGLGSVPEVPNPRATLDRVEGVPGRGRFITLEGPEGAGKTVHGQRLAAALVEHGHSVILTREPGGTRLGERLRVLLLESGGRIEPRADALLFNAARAQLTAEILEPALAAGQVV